MQGSDNPETVFIIFMGTGSVWFPSDTLGDFATGNMAPGNYPVRFLTTTPNYKVLDTNLTIIAGKIDTLAAPIQLQYTGIPVPAGLHIQYDSAREIVTLVWNTPTTGTKVASYNIYREQSDSANFALIKGGLPAPDTTWQDTTAVQDCTYFYRVAAVDTNQTAGVMCGAVGVKIASYFVVDTVLNQSGSGPGQFYGPGNIAIANNGDIYVTDPNNNRIQIFYKDFSFKNQFSSSILRYPYMVVLDSSRNAYVADGAYNSAGLDSIFVFDTMGSLLRIFTIDSLSDIAIEGGELYASLSGTSTINDSISVYTLTGNKINRAWLAGSYDCIGMLSASANALLALNNCLGQVLIFDTLGNTLSSIQVGTTPSPANFSYNSGKERLFVNCITSRSPASTLKVIGGQSNFLAQYRMSVGQPSAVALDQSGLVYEIFYTNNEILRLRCLLP
jgi:hypothetical protein